MAGTSWDFPGLSTILMLTSRPQMRTLAWRLSRAEPDTSSCNIRNTNTGPYDSTMQSKLSMVYYCSQVCLYLLKCTHKAVFNEGGLANPFVAENDYRHIRPTAAKQSLCTSAATTD